MEMDDIGMPPPEDSPKNILNILDDDCLQFVLLKTQHVCYFYNAANVCTRFQQNAKICFPFKEIEFVCQPTDEPLFISIFDKNRLSFDVADNFLSIFASKIKSIEYMQWKVPQTDLLLHKNDINLIGKHCGKTLHKLTVSNLLIEDDRNYNLNTPFHVLKQLTLIRSRFHNLNPALMFPELNYLALLYFVGNNFLANKFPKLQYIRIMCSLTNDTFMEFQNKNPQLQILSMNGQKDLTPSIWEGINDRLPNIISLNLRNLNLLNETIMDIGKLRHLKILYLAYHIKHNHQLTTFKSLISTSIRHNQQIEELQIDSIDDELGQMLLNMPTLKKLFAHRITDEAAVSLAKNLPALEFMYLDELSLPTVRRILMNGKNLSELTIYTKVALSNLGFNMDIYNSLIALAVGRVQVTIYCKRLKPIELLETTLGREEKEIFEQISTQKNEWVHFETGHERNHESRSKNSDYPLP